MDSFIKGYLFEIKGFPRDNDLFTIKDYFYYDSNIQEYGHRETIIPRENIINNNELPEDETIRELINKGIFSMRRSVDLNKQTEMWFFETKCLKEINK
jgi:hypothetical protein